MSGKHRRKVKLPRDRIITTYIVTFSNGTTHHCMSIEEAKQFAAELGGKNICGRLIYGMPMSIIKRTISDVYDEVSTFGGES